MAILCPGGLKCGASLTCLANCEQKKTSTPAPVHPAQVSLSTSPQVVGLRPGDLIVIATDGITEDHLDHIDFAGSATVIADEILCKHAKQTDDALVLAARHRGVST